ncbi:MAG: gamma-glutamyltransferase family protein [Alphaproteobacteria bacterium]|nr:gamma-glutamyltransferase family protein [Alphaproteobacteria bacterium]
MTLSAKEIEHLFRGSATPPSRTLPGEPPFTTRPELTGTFGMVASTHWSGTAAGMSILEKGGNAFDAAIATGLTLQVVEPSMAGPAGDAPIILCDGKTQKVSVICGQGVAPGNANVGAYRNLGLDIVPGAGLLPLVVPGAFDAFMLLLRDWGTMKVRDVLEPAIGHARNGYPIAARVVATIDALKDLFVEHWPSSAAVYCPSGNVPKPNQIFSNPVLADTFERILREAETVGSDREKQIEAARDAFYRGFVAESVDRFCRDNEFLDTSGRRHNGFLSGDDLARWSASVEAPLSLEYGDYTVFKCGPWSQGPVFLQQLALLRGFDLDAMDPNGTEFVHHVAESTKLAFADREKFYGDPDFVDVPMDTLLSEDYNAVRRALIGKTASDAIRPGSIPGYGGPVVYGLPDGQRLSVLDDGTLVPAHDSAPAVSIATGDTVHLDVADEHGNMVSITPSGGWLRSSPTIPDLGFALSNRGQIFTLEEGTPGGIAPGKRPRTTLSPGFANKNGKPYMAFGTPGADRQDQWALQFFLRHVHHGQNLQEAVDAPTFNTSHFPGSFYPKRAELSSLTVEGRFADETVDELRDKGHDVTVGDDWSQGRTCAVARKDGLLKAAATARSTQSYAFGR